MGRINHKQRSSLETLLALLKSGNDWSPNRSGHRVLVTNQHYARSGHMRLSQDRPKVKVVSQNDVVVCASPIHQLRIESVNVTDS
jgi:hypothetical protein